MQPYAHNNQISPPLSDFICNYQLVANVPQEVDWPSGAGYCNINGAASYYSSDNSAITVPTGTVTDGSGCSLAPAQRQRPTSGTGATKFYIISPTAQNISIEFWSN